MTASELNGKPTLADHERLISALYKPGADVTRINAILTGYQRSHHGWEFADELLHSQDAQVRFFGALTFTIKVNTDWNTLSAEDAAALLQRLLTWLIQLVHAGERPFVIRKLCSALVAYFLKPSTSWKRCLRHLLSCFAAGRVVGPDELSRFPSSHELLIQLNTLQLKTTLWFATALVEEVGKTSSKTSQTHHYHEQAALNLEDINSLLHMLLSKQKVEYDIAKEAIKCYQAWVNYAHRSFVVDAPNKDLESLKYLTPLLLQKLTVEDLFEDTVEFFTDVLVNFPAFFSPVIYTSLAAILTSESAKVWISELKAGGFGDEAQDFSRLLFAYGDAAVQDLARNSQDHQSQQVLSHLLDLLDVEGYGGVELQICSQAVEFWQTYTEHATDSLFTAGQEQEPWMVVAKGYIAKALQHSWAKIRSPEPEVVASWASETRADFRSLRQDFTDLVQASFTLLGLSAFEHFAQLALDSLRGQSWYDLEAALLGVNALSDSVAEDSAGDEALSKIFRSRLFDDMMSPVMEVPLQTQVTALGTITDYTSFFERQTEFLPNMLSFLFTFLGHPTLANVAAKAISSTCSSCRKHLVPQINGFLLAYEPYSQADPSVKEKIIGAIAMIIQALPSDEEKFDPLSSLLAYVEKDAACCYDRRAAGRIEEALTSGLCALRSLSNIGKALQTPDEAVIDLEADGIQANAWSLPQGNDLQTRVIRVLHSVTGFLSFDNTIVEAGCQVLRTGYKETTPSLFGLPPDVTVDFVAWGCGSGLSYTGVTYILETATAMVARRKNASALSMSNAASKIWSYVLSLAQPSKNEPVTTDPEVIASCIGLGEKLIPHHFQSFFAPENLNELPGFFKLSLQSLITPEIMPKRAAASFWATFVQKYELAGEIEAKAQIAMHEYGPQLCHALVRNISGDAARSELDVISLPFKRMVFAQPQARTWLSDALQSDSFTSVKVDDTMKRLWLQKVMSLRGGAQTNSAVRELWMTCRGMNMDYTS